MCSPETGTRYKEVQVLGRTLAWHCPVIKDMYWICIYKDNWMSWTIILSLKYSQQTSSNLSISQMYSMQKCCTSSFMINVVKYSSIYSSIYLLLFSPGQCRSWESSRHTACSWVSRAPQTPHSHTRPSRLSCHRDRGCPAFQGCRWFQGFPLCQGYPLALADSFHT